MNNTRSFSETIKENLARSAAFRGALLSEAVGCFAAGDLETAKTVLKEYVDGTIGFAQLSAALGRPRKSLMRMLAPTGNPYARHLFEVIAYLQAVENIQLTVQATQRNAG